MIALYWAELIWPHLSHDSACMPERLAHLLCLFLLTECLGKDCIHEALPKKHFWALEVSSNCEGKGYPG